VSPFHGQVNAALENRGHVRHEQSGTRAEENGDLF